MLRCRKGKITAETILVAGKTQLPFAFPQLCEEICEAALDQEEVEGGQQPKLKAGDIDKHGRLVLSDENCDEIYEVARSF